MRLFRCLALVIVAASPVVGQEPTLVVENGRVIVGDGTVLEEASVAVAGDSILSVTEGPVEAPDARRIDASGKTVLPGLIDAHVHLTIPSDGRDSVDLVKHLNERVPEILNGFLAHGVTTVRSTGEYWPWIEDLQTRIGNERLPGPRVITAGPILTAEGAHPATTVCPPESSFCRSHLTREVTGPEEARRAVRTLADEEVDYVKFVSDSTIVPVQIEDQVVRAIVDQAHREGLKVVGHVGEAEFMERYAEMGVDGFVHPPTQQRSRTPDRVRRLARVLTEHDTPVTTTLSVALMYSEEPAGPVIEGTASSRRNEIEAQAQDVALLAEAGTPIVIGTDWCACGHNEFATRHSSLHPGTVTITEMQMLRWGGMSRQAILRAATADAARALEMEDQVGTLEPGKLADLIVVDGNPLEDLSTLENVEVVVQGGKVVSEG